MLTNKTLLLIDGSSYMYRAFHVLQNLSNTKGEPTGALYGVLNMLKKIEAQYSFDYCCFVIDAKGKNFRHGMEASYKANRPAMPEDLRSQVEWIKKLVSLMGWKVLVVAGVEADDVIATLHKSAKQQAMRVLISTGDKDLAQLVDDTTTLIDTMSDETLDVVAVKDKFGIYPWQIVDYLTLTGDKVDNIKGVTKCGGKTAAKWLQQYETLDNLLAHADEITGKIGENLRTAAANWLTLSRRLITLKDDVDLGSDLPAGLSELVKKDPEWNLLVPEFQYFGFRKWLEEAKKNCSKGDNQEDQDSNTQYYTIRTKQDFTKLKERLAAAKFVGFDTETTSLDEINARLIGMSFSFQEAEAYYLPLDHDWMDGEIELEMDSVLSELTPYFESIQLKKIGQNIKYDQHVLANHGINLQGINGDSMLASYLVESHLGHGLDELAARHLGIQTIKYEDVCGKKPKQISFAAVPLDKATEYAGQDADLSLRLEKQLVALMDDAQRRLYYEVELPILTILGRMERYGVLIDKQELRQQSHELAARILQIEEKVYALVGQEFNLNSPKQTQQVLFEILNIPTQGLKKTPKGDISTNEQVLEQLAEEYEVPKLILSHRSLSKLKSTYTDKLPLMLDGKDRVHTTYAQAVANTGRLASSHPNLQNIPVRTEEGRRIRQAFIAPAGHTIVSADYSQIELRIMAHLSEDENLISAFQHNEDVHRSTASKIFHLPLGQVSAKQRRYAKTINFGLIYGMSEYGLAKSLKIDQFSAKSFIEQYFEQYPGVLRYMETTKQKAHDLGYVETIYGRKLYLQNIYANNGLRRKAAERAAINAPMQGTASDLIKLAMINVQKWLDQQQLQTRMIMQVHDELVFEVPEEELDIVKQHVPLLMTSVANLKVPLLVEIGSGINWELAH